MTEQPTVAVVETPQKTSRLRIKLPSLTTVRNGLALTGAFILGLVVAKRKLERDCVCESDDASTAAGQSTD